MYFSVIVPVYNRPEEIRDFLESVASCEYFTDLEVVVVEDGSSIPCAEVVAQFQNRLDIAYFSKPNSGPGDSRNFGMRQAKGDYFLIFDSDCILPKHYFSVVESTLRNEFYHCFGGPDNAHESFSDIQKAINFAMTSVLTTGGIRGTAQNAGSFQPRSFNMGLSREAFERSGGFGNIHPGEDPDLVMRIWKLGYETTLISDAFVYHKRRIDWKKFRIQVNKFGKARPILNKWHPEFTKPTYFFPAVFVVGFYISIAALLFGITGFVLLYLLYFTMILIVSALKNNIRIGLLSLIAVWIQFAGYGSGFLKSFYLINIRKMEPTTAFPELFFRV